MEHPLKVRNSIFIPKHVIFSSIGMFLLLSAFFFFREDFSDKAFFGGDTWEYHSMAVNFAIGDYFMRFGGVFEFEKYKFENNSDPYFMENFLKLGKQGGTYNFFRAPGYPVLLGLLYKIVGISPSLAKKMNLFLLILSSSLLPIIGYLFWKREGFLCGMISGLIFLAKYHSLAHEIMTEPTLIFVSVLLIFSAHLFFSSPTSVKAFCCGLICALSVLIKGIFLFFPFLFVIWILRKLLVDLKSRTLFAGVFFFSFFIPVILYSTYVSRHFGKFYFVSTQSDNMLLDGNNEFTVEDGDWHPEWRKCPNCFYNKKGLEGSSVMRVIAFYIENPFLLPIALYNKLHSGFDSFQFLKISLILLMTFSLFSGTRDSIFVKFLEYCTNNSPFKMLNSQLIRILGFFKIENCQILEDSQFKEPLLKEPLIAMILLFALVLIVFNPGFEKLFPIFMVAYFVRRERNFEFPRGNIPPVLAILFSSVLVVNLIAFGNARINSILDHFFILFGTYQICFFLETCIHSKECKVMFRPPE
ncbi:MAG: hypothetical protein HQM08_09385 [Candidatus Riflebacteria bacterium]|nr:hypothetical protein [Candidatus Riflebacteria bacterium]